MEIDRPAARAGRLYRTQLEAMMYPECASVWWTEVRWLALLSRTAVDFVVEPWFLVGTMTAALRASVTARQRIIGKSPCEVARNRALRVG